MNTVTQLVIRCQGRIVRRSCTFSVVKTACEQFFPASIHIRSSLRQLSTITHENCDIEWRESPLTFLKLDGDRMLAYRHTPSSRTHSSNYASRFAVLFLPGYMGSMNGAKAMNVERLCHRTGFECARFDYEGVGESPGKLDELVLSDWKNNALAVLDNVIQQNARVVLIGSSMGSWLSMHIARDRSDRIAGIIAIAPAFDFLNTYVKTLPESVQTQIEAGESVPSGLVRGKYNQKLNKRLLDDTIKHNMLHLPSLDIHCPVRILHGMQDDAVPWKQSVNLVNHLESNDVELILRKAGDHRLSTDEDILILENVLIALLQKLERGSSSS